MRLKSIEKKGENMTIKIMYSEVLSRRTRRMPVFSHAIFSLNRRVAQVSSKFEYLRAPIDSSNERRGSTRTIFLFFKNDRNVGRIFLE